MHRYVIKEYQKSFVQDQVRIGIETARHWVWPYAYQLEDLLKIHARPNFDPDTCRYCFLDEEMVGYMTLQFIPPEQGVSPTVNLFDFPRMMPGHEAGGELLLQTVLEDLNRRGITRVTARVCTMIPNDIRLAEKMGFSISDWGHKVYYSYETARGKSNMPDDTASEIDPEKDLDECAEIAAKWYYRPAAWCRSLLEEWHAAGLITHAAVREQGRIAAACMAAPNDVRPSTAAIYYIYTPDASHLKPLLARVVNQCVDYGVHNVIADLINEHRQYEAVYQEMGFTKAAEWARCEKSIA